MKTINEITVRSQRLVTLSALGIVGLMPLVGGASAVRADQDNFYARQVKRRLKGKESQTTTANKLVSFTGAVTAINAGSRLVTVRGDYGKVWQVHTNDARLFRVKDQVTVVGRLINETVEATKITRLTQQVDFTGTVTGINKAGRLLTVRGDMGKVWQVHTNDVRLFQVNDRVTVFGKLAKGTVEATRITRLNELANFTGTVAGINKPGQLLRVRGVNGTMWQVHTNNVGGFRVNDRVAVVGRLNKGTVEATRITRL